MVIVGWLLFFIKKIIFMEDLCSKYVCQSAVALVETTSLGVFSPFSFSSGIWKRNFNRYSSKVLEYTEFLQKIQPSGAIFWGVKLVGRVIRLS